MPSVQIRRTFFVVRYLSLIVPQKIGATIPSNELTAINEPICDALIPINESASEIV
jgi:hypothetical protein